MLERRGRKMQLRVRKRIKMRMLYSKLLLFLKMVRKKSHLHKLGWLTSQESCSYEISLYQSTDDEDEDDDLPNNKFVPSWASKRAVAMVLPMQQEVDPETIFPVETFCSMDQVLLPRRLQG